MNYEKLISPLVKNVPPSGIRKFFDLVTEMEDVISLGVGEPDFITPWHVREACIYSLEKGYTQYTSNWGMIELREYISRYMDERFKIKYNPVDEVLVTVGASEAIDLALRAILQPGDEVIIPEPSYVSYMPCTVFAGGNPVSIVTKSEDSFKLLPDILKQKITSKTKALILPYPNNPTGAIMTGKELEQIADVIRKTDIVVLADEIYAELTYEDTHTCFATLPGMKERTIVINGFSKAFAMTGWRIGFATGPKALIGAMLKIHQYTLMCASTMSQRAAIQALKDGLENNFRDVNYMVKQYNQRRRLMVEGFCNMGLDCYEPLGAFYVFPSIKNTGLTSEEFCEQLLEEERVAVVPGTAFGDDGEGFIRCSYANSIENLSEAIVRIKRFASKHL